MGLAEVADIYRISAYDELSENERSQKGQFFTPPSIACFMASLFDDPPEAVTLLDAGAGVGALTAAFIEDVCQREPHPQKIAVTAYENEESLIPYLDAVLQTSVQTCQGAGVEFESQVISQDFIEASSQILEGSFFSPEIKRFNRAILNPPYKKINSKSKHRRWLRRAGVETSNLYAGFLAMVILLLESGGELVAITPRSFCNGPYFKPFRKLFWESMAFKRIHLFEARDRAFGDDDVLQENIIFHAVKGGARDQVVISTSQGPEDTFLSFRTVHHNQIINPDDPNLFIHIAATELDQNVVDRINLFHGSLPDLGLSVSTGKVVDFRAKECLREQPAAGTAPLIYPTHFENGFIAWPKPQSRKPNAITQTPKTLPMLLPKGFYVAVRRFSSKEESRRIVAAIYDPHRISAERVGFENHLNVFHCQNSGLPEETAKGLALFLNSTLVDIYFRQFNGHTQVNATDLRALLYPDHEVLASWGRLVGTTFLSQKEIDEIVERELQQMANIDSVDPVSARRKVEEALEILIALGMPRGQQNERSAMTLLALLNLTPEMSWSKASEPLMGITPIMDFIREHYGVNYAPNTRETIRRQTMHQFVDAGLAVTNPDRPDRPINSPKWCYQIEPAALELLRTYGSEQWETNVATYLASVKTLKQKYARRRKMSKVPVKLIEGMEIELSPGDHSKLIKAIIEEFVPRFAPGGQVLYVGDTGDKWGYFDEALLQSLGVTVDAHGKMPDVVIYYEGLMLVRLE